MCCSSQAGEAAASHHAHHGLRPAAVPASRGTGHARPGSTLSETVVARGAQADECHQYPAGSSHVPKGNDMLIMMLFLTTLVVSDLAFSLA